MKKEMKKRKIKVQKLVNKRFFSLIVLLAEIKLIDLCSYILYVVMLSLLYRHIYLDKKYDQVPLLTTQEVNTQKINVVRSKIAFCMIGQ